ncbi:MAG TPA: tRNA adenosine(34) deaminase TadA [Candidatus Udaeobacter sp.]|nr:tRNA adenosine(34) deaminase TadA [Candidatus Udaeobacter sp.]
MTPETDARWMREALKLAREARAAGEVPIGAVVVLDDRLLGKGKNQIETLGDPTAHAEILAIGAAANALGEPRLTGATLYSTLEPCIMCSGAIVLARLDRVVYAAEDPRAGACGSLYDIPRDPRLNHRAVVLGGLLADEATFLLRSFFDDLRSGST